MTRNPITVADLDAVAAVGRGSDVATRELVAGVLRAVAPPRVAVVRAVADLAAALERCARDHRVEVRAAVVVGPMDLLRPEVVLVRPAWPPTAEPVPGGAIPNARDAPRPARWAAAGVALAVFVGDDEATLRWRAHRCAGAGVREVWTIALGERRASRWRAPGDGRYTIRDVLPAGEAVAPDALPEVRVVAWR